MSAAPQIFTGEVTGDVAGRDVFKLVLAPEPPESELQAAFRRNTGIDCGRLERLHLEWLMRHQGFHIGELKRADRARSMRWCESDRRWRPHARWFDLVWGYTGLAAMAATLAVMLTMAILRMPAGPMVHLVAGASVAVCASVAYFWAMLTLIPQRTAMRVTKAYLRGTPPEDA